MHLKVLLLAVFVGLSHSFPTIDPSVILHNEIDGQNTTHDSYHHYSVEEHDTEQAKTTNSMNATTTESPSTIQDCNPQICAEQICHVNGSISRPSFYARCPTIFENDQDLTKYCMCAAAYHAEPGITSTGEARPSYITITPDGNCEIPQTDEDKALCTQEKCQGPSRKNSRQAYICRVESKLYCACFN